MLGIVSFRDGIGAKLNQNTVLPRLERPSRLVRSYKKVL